MSKINIGKFSLAVKCIVVLFLVINLYLFLSLRSSFSFTKFTYFWLKICQPGMTKNDVLARAPNFKPYFKKGEIAKKWILYSNANDIKVTGEILSCVPSANLFLKETEESNVFDLFAFLSATHIVVNEDNIVKAVYWGY